MALTIKMFVAAFIAWVVGFLYLSVFTPRNDVFDGGGFPIDYSFVIGVSVFFVPLSFIFVFFNSHFIDGRVPFIFSNEILPLIFGCFISLPPWLILLAHDEYGPGGVVARFIFFGVIPIGITAVISYWPRFSAQLRENPEFRRWFHFGRGKNAMWASVHSFEESKVKLEKRCDLGGLYMGRTLTQDDLEKHEIGLKDDAHQVTIAQTGAGKSISAIWPNMMLYSGPMVVLDPKGEHTNFSADFRGAWVLDPYANSERQTDFYNPLSEIDINDDGARGLIQAISGGVVLDDNSSDIHFTESARTVIEGVIAHVLSRFPEREQTLPRIVEIFRGYDPELGVSDPEGFDQIIADMSANDAAGGLPMDAANTLLSAADRERGSILTTCFRSLKWVNDPPMKKVLSSSNFTLKALVGAPNSKTLFIVLPFDYMETTRQIRWMRVMVNLMNSYLFRHPRPSTMPPLLFVLDEFFKLGHMKMLEEGVVTARGAGAKYWILLQNIGQLKELYGKNWETFMGASNVQLFGLGNDGETMKWAAEALGGMHEQGSGNYPLMRPDEVKQFLGKDEPTQIVIRSTGAPMRLERVAYKPIKKYRGIGLD